MTSTTAGRKIPSMLISFPLLFIFIGKIGKEKTQKREKIRDRHSYDYGKTLIHLILPPDDFFQILKIFFLSRLVFFRYGFQFWVDDLDHHE